MPEYEPHTTTIVQSLPECDLKRSDPMHCRGDRRYDTALSGGPWANVCEAHFILYGSGLGLGRGQELLTQERVDAERALDTASVMFLADPHNQFKQEVWLAAHARLMDVMHPSQAQPKRLADSHPMRNHPAYRAMQARLEEENQ